MDDLKTSIMDINLLSDIKRKMSDGGLKWNAKIATWLI